MIEVVAFLWTFGVPRFSRFGNSNARSAPQVCRVARGWGRHNTVLFLLNVLMAGAFPNMPLRLGHNGKASSNRGASTAWRKSFSAIAADGTVQTTPEPQYNKMSTVAAGRTIAATSTAESLGVAVTPHEDADFARSASDTASSMQLMHRMEVEALSMELAAERQKRLAAEEDKTQLLNVMQDPPIEPEDFENAGHALDISDLAFAHQSFSERQARMTADSITGGWVAPFESMGNVTNGTAVHRINNAVTACKNHPLRTMLGVVLFLAMFTTFCGAFAVQKSDEVRRQQQMIDIDSDPDNNRYSCCCCQLHSTTFMFIVATLTFAIGGFYLLWSAQIMQEVFRQMVVYVYILLLAGAVLCMCVLEIYSDISFLTNNARVVGKTAKKFERLIGQAVPFGGGDGEQQEGAIGAAAKHVYYKWGGFSQGVDEAVERLLSGRLFSERRGQPATTDGAASSAADAPGVHRTAQAS
eukprot:TRINITY_DN17959_c0_g1_i1.p1 TRINITY_DN17959_c0_g1~~TRINITY_DN17959_c0_g1_i1.p1  ORF type:complete len:469 (-),score=43.21 TRINITY_DN17959_c0_g1_i1:23-1429(-)